MKHHVIHFDNGSGGGVSSVIRNLISSSVNPKFEHHIIYTINRKLQPDFAMPDVPNVSSQRIFEYRPKNNFYHTCKKLAGMLTGSKDLVVIHDWLEAGMISNLGLPNPAVQIVHGNYAYYYELAEKHRNEIDAFACVSPVIDDKLKKRLPAEQNRVFFTPFPVPYVEFKATGTGTGPLKLCYFVRDITDENKNFKVIVQIAEQLADAPERYFFNIIGAGMTQAEFFNSWPSAMRDRVKYHGSVANDFITDFLPAQDIFLLPSVYEGLPVSLIEAMKAGVVPMVTEWDYSIKKLVNGETGFVFSNFNPGDYCYHIRQFSNNRESLGRLSINAARVANEMYDPQKNTAQIEKVFEFALENSKQNKKASKVYGSRLDNPRLPNFLTTLVRSV